jgi:hypothetical protein
MSKHVRSASISNPPARKSKESRDASSADLQLQAPSHPPSGNSSQGEQLRQLYDAIERLSRKVDNVEESLQRIERKQDDQIATLIRLTVYFSSCFILE